MESNWDSVASEVQFTLAIDSEITVSHLPRSGRLLDIGCGYGRNTAFLTSLGYPAVIGYDSSRHMIQRGRTEHPMLDLRHHDGAVLPEHDGAFVGALGCAILTAIPSQSARAALLTELQRVLVPDGPFYIVEFLRQPDRRYSPQGTFASSGGCTMKHFDRSELLYELAAFNVGVVKEAPTTTLSGGRATALHVIARRRWS